jgi:hypothetical protein
MKWPKSPWVSREAYDMTVRWLESEREIARMLRHEVMELHRTVKSLMDPPYYNSVASPSSTGPFYNGLQSMPTGHSASQSNPSGLVRTEPAPPPTAVQRAINNIAGGDYELRSSMMAQVEADRQAGVSEDAILARINAGTSLEDFIESTASKVDREALEAFAEFVASEAESMPS